MPVEFVFDHLPGASQAVGDILHVNDWHFVPAKKLQQFLGLALYLTTFIGYSSPFYV
jgi:glycogen synthase